MSVEKKLRPLFSYEQLTDYFKNKIPKKIDPTEYNQGLLSCVGFARLMVEELGGPNQAKIYWIDQDNRGGGHAYVAPTNYSPRKIALNSYIKKQYSTHRTGPHTVGYLRKYGEDITQEILDCKWSEL